MADVAVAEPLHLQQHRIVVAVDEYLLNREAVSRCLSLHPERLARAAEEGGEPAFFGGFERRFVHEAHHQHLAALGVLDDRRDETIEFRKIHAAYLPSK